MTISNSMVSIFYLMIANGQRGKSGKELSEKILPLYWNIKKNEIVAFTL